MNTHCDRIKTQLQKGHFLWDKMDITALQNIPAIVHGANNKRDDVRIEM